MTNHAFPIHSTQDLVEALVALRDSVRPRLPLLSTDALRHWEELESQLDCVQSRIEYEGARIRPSATEKVRELTETVSEFLREHTTRGVCGVPSV